MVSKDKIIKSTIGAVIGVATADYSASSTTCNIFRL